MTTVIQPIRLTSDERGTVQRAAELKRQTMSDLIRAATLEAAARILKETT